MVGVVARVRRPDGSEPNLYGQFARCVLLGASLIFPVLWSFPLQGVC